MIETPEGMGSRKFSFQVEGGLTAETQSLVLCQGAQKLAHLTPDGKAVKFLLVVSPQLWVAANDVLQHALKLVPYSELNDPLKNLAEMVAKAVGKQDYSKVEQA